jgi:hypothetical protein
VASLLNGSRWSALPVVALLITACGGGSASTSPQPAKRTSASVSKPKLAAATKPPDDNEQLNKLLTVRASALQSGEADTYAGTATGAQVRKDTRIIGRAKLLPLDTVRMLARGVEVNKDRATLRVDLVYAFKGIDTEYVKTSRMTALRTDKGWKIAADRPSAGALAPWEYATYKPHTSRHFLALTPKGLKVGALMKDLEAGREKMKHALRGVKAPDRTLVIVARTGTDTKALTRNLHTLSAVIAVAEASQQFAGPSGKVSNVSGQRVFVLWRSYGHGNTKERRMVVAHELTHAALAWRTGARVPAWLVEGIAMYISGDRRGGEAGAILSGARLRDSSKEGAARHALSLGRLAKPTSMDHMNAVGVAFAYSYASAAAYTVAQKHGGVKALLRLYSTFNSPKLHGRPGRKLSDRAVHRALHISLSQLESETKAYAMSISVV